MIMSNFSVEHNFLLWAIVTVTWRWFDRHTTNCHKTLIKDFYFTSRNSVLNFYSKFEEMQVTSNFGTCQMISRLSRGLVTKKALRRPLKIFLMKRVLDPTLEIYWNTHKWQGQTLLDLVTKRLNSYQDFGSLKSHRFRLLPRLVCEGRVVMVAPLGWPGSWWCWILTGWPGAVSCIPMGLPAASDL